MIIPPEMVGVHNSKTINQVEIKVEIMGHYLDEFCITYKPVKHSRPDIGAIYSSRFVPRQYSAQLIKAHRSQKIKKVSQVLWHALIVPATWEAEAGELLEPRRQRLQWAEMAPLHSSQVNRVRLISKKNQPNLTWNGSEPS